MLVHDGISAGGAAGPGRDPRRAPRGWSGGQEAGQAGHAGLLGAGGARPRRAGDDPGPEPDPGARAAAPAPPADGGLAVELLPGGGGGDGGRPGRPAEQRADGPALRRRPRAELRAVGDPGAEPGLRPARLRRDAARPVRVGSQAVRGQPGGGGAGEPAQAGQGRGRGGRRGGGLLRPDAALRQAARAGASGTTACTPRACWATSSRPTAGRSRCTSSASASGAPATARSQSSRPWPTGGPGSIPIRRYGSRSATRSRPTWSATCWPSTG